MAEDCIASTMALVAWLHSERPTALLRRVKTVVESYVFSSSADLMVLDSAPKGRPHAGEAWPRIEHVRDTSTNSGLSRGLAYPWPRGFWQSWKIGTLEEQYVWLARLNPCVEQTSCQLS